MPDGGTPVLDVSVTVIAVALTAVLVIHLIRAPRTALAVIGVLCVALGTVASVWAPRETAWDGALNVLGYALVFTAYPDGRIAPRWLIAPVLFFGAVAVGDLLFGAALALSPAWQILTPLCVLLVLVAIHRYRRRLSTPERESMRWALLGVILPFIGMPVLVAATALSGMTIAGLGIWGEATADLLICATPVALTIGLVAPHLAPVDGVLRQVLRVFATAAPLVLLAALCLAATPAPVGAWLAVAATGVLAVPLWHAATRLADWFVSGRRLAPDEAVRLLDERLASAADAADAPRIVAELTVLALGSPRVSVVGPHLHGVVAPPSSPDASVPSAPDPRAPGRAFPQAVRYGGSDIAVITAEPRRAETALTRADRSILGRIAVRSAPALHAARAVTDLVQARAAIVIAHEEERKRLRRDLHDDLAPTLVGLHLTVSGLARLLREQDAGELAAAADALVSDVQSAVAQTRALAYGLRPPGLDDGGLAAAVRERARSADGLHIAVDAPTTPLDVPAAVELAALRVVQEAVANVRRHADATRCEVRIGLDDGALQVAVDDDGTGMPAGYAPGIGLDSMRERVAELGGRLRVGRSGLGGVRISATLPATSPTLPAPDGDDEASP